MNMKSFSYLTKLPFSQLLQAIALYMLLPDIERLTYTSILDALEHHRSGPQRLPTRCRHLVARDLLHAVAEGQDHVVGRRREEAVNARIPRVCSADSNGCVVKAPRPALACKEEYRARQ